MKIVFSYIHFPVWPYPPKIMEKKNVFYTSKLYRLTGMLMASLMMQTIRNKHCQAQTDSIITLGHGCHPKYPQGQSTVACIEKDFP